MFRISDRYQVLIVLGIEDCVVFKCIGFGSRFELVNGY